MKKSGLNHLNHWRAAVVLAVFGVLLSGCSDSNKAQWQGYIEGEYVLVASPIGGALEQLNVKRGDQVKTGDILFGLEHAPEEAARNEAAARLVQAKARLENILKGKRPTEIESIEARLAQAQASLELSQAEYKRWEKLKSDGVASQSEFDRVRASYERDQRLVAEWNSELATAKLGGRTDEVQAAEAEVSSLKAALTRAEWNLNQKKQYAPTNGMVFDTLYRSGEWVSAGGPVVSILPPGNVKTRFFVQQTRLGALKIGQKLSIKVDGASNSYPAIVTYIAPQAEYTPPVIYSRDNRAKLVFMVEAAFEKPDPAILHPGQPVDVQLVTE
jgi:HlyD family secretion protein